MRLIPCLLLLLAATAHAQSDPQAYCTYLTEQAAAQSDLLKTPNGVAGLTQQETGLPTQIVAGATLSLSSVKRAGITVDAANKNCGLYKATTAVQQSLLYALPSVEKDALTDRLALIEQATKSVDDLIAQTTRMVDAQNMTRPQLLGLQITKIKLEADRAETQAKIAAIYVPTLAAEPLKQQVATKQASEVAEQQALDHLARQSNWDVELTVGAHQQINPFSHGPGPYGEVSATYNFATRAIDRHLDRTADAYVAWKKVQQGDVTRGADILHTQLLDSIAAQQTRLETLNRESDEIATTLKLVADPDTSAAYDFRNQLTTTQLLLSIETADSTYRLDHLRDFLTRNY